MKKFVLLLTVIIFCCVSVSPVFSQGQRRERNEEDAARFAYENIVDDSSSVTLEEGEVEAPRTLSDVEYYEYRIRPHIVLHVELAGEGELESPGLDLKVSKKGTIRYPYVGEVDVLDLSPEEVARKLEKLLEKDYVRAAQVTVVIAETPKYFILGKIAQPGRYGMVLDRGITLVEAIVLAGGIDKKEGLFREGWAIARVIRTEEGERREYVFRADRIDETFTVQPDDIIIVEYGKRMDLGSYYILGEVDQPGRYPIVAEEFSAKKIQRYDVWGQKYITLLGAASVLDAILVAEGFTDDAARNYVRLRRKVGKTWYGTTKYKTFRIPVGHIYYTGDLKRNVKLKDGDVITVPESWF